jgi:hypothetical protein
MRMVQRLKPAARLLAIIGGLLIVIGTYTITFAEPQANCAGTSIAALIQNGR